VIINIIGNTINHIKEVVLMATQKIAITVPSVFLERLNQWAKKMGRSRSRFIVEEMDERLRELEDEEVTRIYNETYSDPEIAAQDRQLAEEMLNISAIHEVEEKW
jgi:predicted DNA-binding protein